MNICVVGSGYVGLVTGACLAEFGNRVTCVDKDAGKIERLRAGEIPVYEPGLDAVIQRNTKDDRLSFTTDLASGIRDALVIFIAVGTPQDEDGQADLTYVREERKTIPSALPRIRSSCAKGRRSKISCDLIALCSVQKMIWRWRFSRISIDRSI